MNEILMKGDSEVCLQLLKELLCTIKDKIEDKNDQKISFNTKNIKD